MDQVSCVLGVELSVCACAEFLHQYVTDGADGQQNHRADQAGICMTLLCRVYVCVCMCVCVCVCVCGVRGGEG